MKGCNGNPTWWDNIPSEFKLKRCYHTTWQSNSGMRFILLNIVKDQALLGTKHNRKTFLTKLSELRDTNSHKLKQK